MNKCGVDPGIGPLLKSLPPALEGNLDHPSVQASDGIELGLRCGFRRDDRTGNSQLACPPGHPLCHVPCGRRQHTALELLGRKVSDRIRGAADLERANRLEILQLQIDIRRQIKAVQSNQRRAQRDANGFPPCMLNSFNRNHARVVHRVPKLTLQITSAFKRPPEVAAIPHRLRRSDLTNPIARRTRAIPSKGAGPNQPPDVSRASRDQPIPRTTSLSPHQAQRSLIVAKLRVPFAPTLGHASSQAQADRQA